MMRVMHCEVDDEQYKKGNEEQQENLLKPKSHWKKKRNDKKVNAAHKKSLPRRLFLFILPSQPSNFTL